MQALKLVRKIMEVNCLLLPRCIVHSLVSIAENAEDNFSRVAIETICEISISFFLFQFLIISDSKSKIISSLQRRQITYFVYIRSKFTRTSRKLITSLDLFIKHCRNSKIHSTISRHRCTIYNRFFLTHLAIARTANRQLLS